MFSRTSFPTQFLAVLTVLLIAILVSMPNEAIEASEPNVVHGIEPQNAPLQASNRADAVLDYTCNMYYYWAMPVGGLGCEILGMRFTNPYPCPCTLTNLDVALYNSPVETTDTTGDLEITIYDVVEDWPPYTEIYSVTVPNGSFEAGWSGSPLNVVNIPVDPIVMDGEAEWVVGITTASAEDGDTLLLLSDDASCPKQRSVCWNPWLMVWQDLWIEWQIDVNFHIYSTIEVGCLVGDFDFSGGVDIDDLVALLDYLFSGPPPAYMFSADADCNCQIDIDDVVYLIDFIFSQGPPPCSLDEWVTECGGIW